MTTICEIRHTMAPSTTFTFNETFLTHRRFLPFKTRAVQSKRTFEGVYQKANCVPILVISPLGHSPLISFHAKDGAYQEPHTTGEEYKLACGTWKEERK